VLGVQAPDQAPEGPSEVQPAAGGLQVENRLE
jgi:hypothetical protein